MAAKITAGHILYALARHFDWFQNRMMPEWEIDGGQADLLFISRAGYATEIEIKISLSDWNHDRDKKKWNSARPHVARFFYAVPEHLADKIPDWIDPAVGVLAVRVNRYGYAAVRTVREARRARATKIDQQEFLRMYEACYYRFWRAELARRRERFAELH